jgi:hypothetical protein
MKKLSTILLIIIAVLIGLTDHIIIRIIGMSAAIIIGLFTLYRLYKTDQNIQQFVAQQTNTTTDNQEKQHAAHMVLDYTAKALPVHNEQMNDVIATTEDAVLTLGDCFSSLLENINESVTLSLHIKNEIIGTGESGLTSRLYDNEKIIKRFDSCIEIQTEKSTLLLKQFAAIADEVRNLSMQSTETGDKKPTSLNNLQQTMGQFETMIKLFIEENSATLESVRTHMITVASDIGKDVIVLDDKVSQLVIDAESAQTKTSDIMVSLQFQDSVRQILEHVQEDLFKISNDISSLDILLSISDRDKSHQLEEDISKSYTMKSERQAYLRATTNSGVGANSKADPGSKEKNKDKVIKSKQETTADDEITFF